MNKQKLFRILSVLGAIFAIMGVISYVYTVKTRGEVIQHRVEIPKEFSKYFDRILARQRYADMGRATFMSPENRRVNWRMFDGDYLLVNFWATWCAPCVLELPSLGRLKKQFEGQGLNVISISIDATRSHDDIKAFLSNRGIGEFAAYLDDVGEVQKTTYMRGIPTSYLLDRRGRILYIFEGDAVWDSSSSFSFFKELLNQKSE